MTLARKMLTVEIFISVGLILGKRDDTDFNELISLALDLLSHDDDTHPGLISLISRIGGGTLAEDEALSELKDLNAQMVRSAGIQIGDNPDSTRPSQRFISMFFQGRASMQQVSPIRAVEAAEALSFAFTWRQSPEGSEYWNMVYRRLLAIANRYLADHPEEAGAFFENLKRARANGRKDDASNTQTVRGAPQQRVDDGARPVDIPGLGSVDLDQIEEMMAQHMEEMGGAHQQSPQCWENHFNNINPRLLIEMLKHVYSPAQVMKLLHGDKLDNE